MRSVWLVIGLSACTPNTSSSPRGPLSSGQASLPTTGDTATGSSTSTFTLTTGTTSATGSTTGDTGPDTGLLAYDCSRPNPPVGPPQGTDFVTEEDFDFDPRGYLVSQKWDNIEGLDSYGTVKVFAANVGSDPAGLRVLSTGDLAVAQPDLGGVLWIDVDTGAKNNIASGLTFPNALAADSRGYLFVSEYTSNGRVRQIDPYTGEQWAVAGNFDNPNGIELSPDEQRLYISEAPWGGDGQIYVVPRINDTTWGEPQLFFTPSSGQYYTIGMDVCENLYIVDYSDGTLFRVSKEGVGERLLSIDTWGSYSAVRFGNGIGGFERTELYVTRRAELYRIEIGIPGKLPVYY